VAFYCCALQKQKTIAMKKIVFLLLILAHSTFAQLKNGDRVPNLQFDLLNAPVTETNLYQLKGKVVLIEFWATWCGSCIVAMPHLKKLQSKYHDKLRIISVSYETPKRIRQFLKVRPSEVWFASDTTLTISNTFPHQLIPHTVLISPDGKLVANTRPELVTEKVVESLLQNQTVELQEKIDNKLTYEDLMNIHFSATDTVTKRFMIQPRIKGAPGFSTSHLDNRAFNGRRITAINCGLSTLYRIAHDDFPYSRTVDKIPDPEKKAYCIDIIVADKKELLPQLRKELSKIFDVRAEVRSEIKDAYVLRITDPEKVKKIPVNTSDNRTYYARHGEIDQQSMTLTDFAAYLESYGTADLPVVDETNNTQKFDIKFSFQPEDPGSLTKILTDMGLTLEKAKRKIDILYVW
jgi:thiol-disulfide isomerase/thioredoxin